jgi:hypothetical protein
MIVIKEFPDKELPLKIIHFIKGKQIFVNRTKENDY